MTESRRAIALHSFSGDAAGNQISFEKGQTLEIAEELDSGWCWGQISTEAGDSPEGYFPREYIEFIAAAAEEVAAPAAAAAAGDDQPAAVEQGGGTADAATRPAAAAAAEEAEGSAARLAIALHSFAGDAAGNQISFDKGQTLEIVEELDSGWCWGQISTEAGDAPEGYFPLEYIEYIAEPGADGGGERAAAGAAGGAGPAGVSAAEGVVFSNHASLLRKNTFLRRRAMRGLLRSIRHRALAMRPDDDDEAAYGRQRWGAAEMSEKERDNLSIFRTLLAEGSDGAGGGSQRRRPPPPAGADGGNDAADLRDRVFSPLLLARSNAIAECEVEGCDARVDARRSQFCVRHLGKCVELW